MSQFRLHLFGTFRVTWNDQTRSDLYSGKVRALLAYLTVETRQRPVSRETLAELFWEGYPHASALQSLRSALYQVRQALAPSSCCAQPAST